MSESQLGFRFEGKSLGKEGPARVSATIVAVSDDKLTMLGTLLWADGTSERLNGTRTAKLSAEELRQAEEQKGTKGAKKGKAKGGKAPRERRRQTTERRRMTSGRGKAGGEGIVCSELSAGRFWPRGATEAAEGRSLSRTPRFGPAARRGSSKAERCCVREGKDRRGRQGRQDSRGRGDRRCRRATHYARNHRLPFAHGDRRRHQRRHAGHHRRSANRRLYRRRRHHDLSAACRRRHGRQHSARLGQPDRRPEPGDQAPLGRDGPSK